jgi:recombination protein RecR
MKGIPTTLNNLIEKLIKFPGIGRRSAERIAYFILNKLSLDEVKAFSDNLVKLKEDVRFCSICHNITDKDICDICNDEQRDRSTICIV